MKRRFIYLIVLCCLLMRTGSSHIIAGNRQNASEHLSKPYVLLVSLDGYRFDYTKNFKPRFLSRFKKKYSGSKALIPVCPSKTFTNHYSIVTGMYAESHGIVANEFYDPERKERYSISNRSTVKDGSWYGGTPLWVLAEKQGMLTAPYFWVGSEADILGTRPTYYYPFDSKVPYMERACQVIKWLKLPLEERPHFITLYFSMVDTIGHRHGPGSGQLKNAVFEVDGVLEWLHREIKKLKLPVNIIIVSDHGMLKINTTNIEYLDEYVDTARFHIEIFDTHCFFYAGNLSRSYVDSVYKTLKKRGKFFNVFKRNDLPEHYHLSGSKRAGDIIVAAKPGAIVTLKSRGDKYAIATHGYDPYENEKMNGIFYCGGPGIKPGIVLEAFENIHIYPFIVRLLGLKSPDTKIDGDIRVLAPLLKPSK